jgi:hypothetical protein
MEPSFDDHAIDALSRQRDRGRQAGRTGSDHEHRDFVHHILISHDDM